MEIESLNKFETTTFLVPTYFKDGIQNRATVGKVSRQAISWCAQLTKSNIMLPSQNSEIELKRYTRLTLVSMDLMHRKLFQTKTCK
jgi:hypothetical protein